MAGFRVLAVDEDDADGVNVLVELERDDAPCPGCGTFSTSVKQRPVVRLADAPAGGRKVAVFWRKRRLSEERPRETTGWSPDGRRSRAVRRV
jgi:transposase